MTELDDELLPAVLELIEEVGKVVTFVTSTLTDDPTSGKVLETDVTEHEVKVAPPYEFSQRLIDGETVQVGDLHVIAAAQGLAFAIGLASRVVIDGVTYRVAHVKPIYSGELVAAYDVQVRR